METFFFNVMSKITLHTIRFGDYPSLQVVGTKHWLFNLEIFYFGKMHTQFMEHIILVFIDKQQL